MILIDEDTDLLDKICTHLSDFASALESEARQICLDTDENYTDWCIRETLNLAELTKKMANIIRDNEQHLAKFYGGQNA